jgi:putative DNA methylase
MTYRKKLIEVALPLEAINMESAREKSIRHGHPSTLHLWWARRPLAACRAVLWSSLVDDPSSWPERFPTEEAQKRERQRLFDILGRITIETDRKGKEKQVVRGLVSWDDIKDPAIIEEAQREIARSLAWGRGEESPTKPEAVREYIAQHAPPVYDPFAGGGSIPLEAQRLGLEAHASDLNPVAVLINKALIEIPPKFKDMPPVNPEDRQRAKLESWKGAQGLAADVRYYGKWMRDEAFKRIGHLYPPVQVVRQEDGTYRHATESEIANSKSKIEELTVIAWIWARTVKCPNPACGCEMPLVSSFKLSTKQGKEAWIEPISDASQTPPVIKFRVKTGEGTAPEPPKTGRGAKFNCLACEQPSGDKYIKAEGIAGQIGAQLMAIVAEGKNSRVYLSPSSEHEKISKSARPPWKPTQQLANDPRNIWCVQYGLDTFDTLFTSRQLVALTTFSDLINEVRQNAIADAIAARLPDDDGIKTRAYGDAIATYIGLSLDKAVDSNTSLCSWQNRMDRLRNTFGRQALPMVWDFAETNPFAGATGDFWGACKSLCEVLDRLQEASNGLVLQKDSRAPNDNKTLRILSTDPPYYDNIGYADLSDFFYVWLRRSIQSIYPEIFSTILVPKAQELVATPYRFDGSKQKAKVFFEEGLGQAFSRMREVSCLGYPS